MRQWRRFMAAAPADRHLLMGAVSLLAATRVALWLLPFRTVQRLLGCVAQGAPVSCVGEASSADRIAWAVSVAGRYLPAATCLVQALAAQILLTRQGQIGRLRIGVARGAEGEFQAHAWLECQGRVIIGGSGIDRYVPLLALEGKTS